MNESSDRIWTETQEGETNTEIDLVDLVPLTFKRGFCGTHMTLMERGDESSKGSRVGDRWT